MIRNVLGLIAAMLMIGAASAAPASDPSYLGNWARADGKPHIRVEPCGKSVCGVNTWVRPGMKHEKVGDRLVLKIRPAGASPKRRIKALDRSDSDRWNRNLEGYVRSPARGLGVTNGDLT
jgi:uncharacterized protein (DUF2147 family)